MACYNQGSVTPKRVVIGADRMLKTTLYCEDKQSTQLILNTRYSWFTRSGDRGLKEFIESLRK